MSPAQRILVVEDEPDIATLVVHALTRAGDIQALTVPSGDAALAAIAEQRPDLIVLDLNLPVLSGLEVCRILRQRPATPTSRSSCSRHVPVRATGHRARSGRDDYVTKPFSPRELAARVRAVLRRRQQDGAIERDVYRGQHLTADFEAVSVTVDGRPVTLTRREFELLRCLVENRERVLSRDRLLERVWGYDHPIETRSVDVHVGRLRAKLGTAGAQIETVIGIGYRFVER